MDENEAGWVQVSQEADQEPISDRASPGALDASGDGSSPSSGSAADPPVRTLLLYATALVWQAAILVTIVRWWVRKGRSTPGEVRPKWVLIMWGAVLATTAVALVAAGLSRLGLEQGRAVWFIGWSVVTFLAYAYDKGVAQLGDDKQNGTTDGTRGRSAATRVPEILLHLLSIIGGFAGAWLGRRLLRHKTRDEHIAFPIVIYASLILHVILIVRDCRGH